MLHHSKRESGFALPFVLATLLVLSLTVAIVTEKVLDAQALATAQRLDAQARISAFDVEAELIWRTLLEAHAVETNVLTGERTYGVRSPETSLPGQGTPHVPRSVYPSLWEGRLTDARRDRAEGEVVDTTDIDTPDDDVTVELRDIRGLLDVNYPDLNYLTFVAERFGVEPALRADAASELRAEIAKRSGEASRDLIEEGGLEQFEQDLFKGLSDVAEVCALPRWRSAALCKNPVRLRRMAVAGYGLLPNILVSPVDVQAFLLGTDKVPSDLARLELAWADVRARGGFDDVFMTLGDGGEVFALVLDRPGRSPENYLLDVRVQPDGRPYRLHRLSTPRTLPGG